jgi:NhaP-type Na+/H+ and K+/H+ antiporter
VEASHQLILLGSVLVLLNIFAGVFSARFGVHYCWSFSD